MRGLWLVGLLLLAACGTRQQFAASGTATDFECAPFARALSGIQLFGEADGWWEAASGKYARGSEPVEGGVLVFRRSSRLPSGHVSVVTRRVSDREIRVTQANWVHHRITRDEPVQDVSPSNDWTRVRVWWDPARSIGRNVYETYGFISPPGTQDQVSLMSPPPPP